MLANHYIIDTVIVVLMCLLTLVFLRCFYCAFRPSALYQTHTKIVSALISFGEKTWAPEDGFTPVPIEEMGKQQLQKWVTNVQSLVVANRFCYFFSSRLKEYQKSNITVGFDLLGLFVLVVVTVVFFGVINYGLYKSVGGSFALTVPAHYSIFLYYSVANLFGRGINEVTPICGITRIMSVFEMVFSFALIAVLIALFFSVKNKRDSEEIDAAIAMIKSHGKQVDLYMQEKYKTTVKAAIAELDKMKGAFIKIIYYLSSNIDIDD